MEITEQISKFQEFLEAYYYSDLLNNIRKGDKFLAVDFSTLSKFSPELSELLLESPEDTIRAAEIAVEKFDFEEDVKNFKIRFKNLPETQQFKISDIRSSHISKFIQIEGIIKQKTDVRPQVTNAKFECPSCGTIINVLQIDTRFKEPQRCSCGRKGVFRLVGKELVDAQKIVVEESPEALDGGSQPKRLNVFLKNDLVSPLSEKRTTPGSRVRLTGIIKDVPIILSTGGKSTRFDLMNEANFMEPVAEDFFQVEISEEEMKQFKELSKDPAVYEKFVNSIAPTIFGHEKVKEALILQLMGGVRKKKKDGTVIRGDIHVLLIGDPGSGKSQMLKRISLVAPKGRYISGKGASGAGMTATVVKDDFLKGYALEAGALVLTNRGICCIDELDKMSKEDTSAMHEALEQQSFHYNTRIILADGAEVNIGDFVEKLLYENKDEVIIGKDCFILPLEKPIYMLSTDWKKTFKIKINRVSKHIAPDKLIKIKIKNGREIIVTPEHPVFCIEHGSIVTKEAEKLVGNECVPVPLELPIYGEKQKFETKPEEFYNLRSSNHIRIPIENDSKLYRIIGYCLSEGSKETNRKKLIGINFTNQNNLLLDDFTKCMDEVFNLQPYKQERKDHHKPRWMLRYISRELATFIQKNCPTMIKRAKDKSIPNWCLKGKKEDIAELLQCILEGDGHVSKKKRTMRIGFASTSRLMCEQVQDLLLRFRIRTNLTEHKSMYKVSITGYENITRFADNVGFFRDEKNRIIKDYLNKTKLKRSVKDNIPSISQEVIYLMKKYSIKQIQNNKLATMKHDYLIRNRNILRPALQYLLNELRNKVRGEDKELLENLNILAFGAFGWEKIKSIDVIKNHDQKWTYDVTIEPTHNFISQNMILHNTISINKANIQATLRAETTVLAAANPKFGRFDPFELIAKQIDLPTTLINRFDLIFPIRDLPDRDRDEKMASFILKLHQKDVDEAELSTELIKKYVSYARQKVNPKLTDVAFNEIKKYYVDMRTSSEGEGAIKTIPISARQLEALIRLSEASARVRLSEKITKVDARRAIELVTFCLSQVALDSETGKIDIDRISTGITATQRSNIAIIREIITELEKVVGKLIPEEDIIREAKAKNISEDKIEEILEKLKRSGDLYSPKHGFLSKM